MTGNYETGGLEIGAQVNSWGDVGVGYVRTVVNEETAEEIRSFVAERDWSQFHTPENLAKSISIEAAELLECYQWDADADVARVREELADVVTYAFMLADRASGSNLHCDHAHSHARYGPALTRLDAAVFLA